MTKDKRLTLILSLGALILALLFFFIRGFAPRTPPANILWGSGMIEGDEVQVSPKISGKVVRLLVREGDQVKLGAPIAYLDSQEIQARVKAAKAQVVRLEREVEKAKVALDLTKEVVEKGITEARAAMKAAIAQVEGTRAQWEKWKKDWLRFKALKEKRVISQRRLDEVEAAAKGAQAQWKGAQEELKRAQAALEKALAQKREVTLRKKEVAVLESALASARAQLEEAQALLDDTKIYSPVQGRVVEKLVEEGEVVTAGTPLVVVTDLDRLYLKVYIPETQVGRIALGQEARIYVDAFPDKPFPAWVCYVAPRSEFTPKEVQTHQERVQYTFAVKLCVRKNRDHLLKPGMPGDGVIKVKQGPWWNPIKQKRVP